MARRVCTNGARAAGARLHLRCRGDDVGMLDPVVVPVEVDTRADLLAAQLAQVLLTLRVLTWGSRGLQVVNYWTGEDWSGACVHASKR